MKRFITCILAVACAGALCVGLVGCGSGGSKGSDSASSASTSVSASASATTSTSTKATSSSSTAKTGEYLDPATINPGWLDDGVREYDVWYRDGDTSAEGIYFSYDESNEAGLSFTRVDANNQDGDSEFNLVITEDKHLRTPEGTAPKIDIVFDDEMNCYDYVKGEFYCRGDLKKLTSMVAGKSYKMDGDRDIVVTFNPDGTYVETVDGESETGTWKVAAATVVEMTYDSDGYVEEYRLTIDGNSVPTIRDSNGDYYDLV